jgi:hypothetical protein
VPARSAFDENEVNDWAEDTGSVGVVIPQSTVARGHLDHMVSLFGGPLDVDMDSLWLLPDSDAVVRLENFDSTTTDDCGTSGAPFFIQTYHETVTTVQDPGTVLLRQSIANGSGRCGVLTTTIQANHPLVVLMGSSSHTELIPDYRFQITTLESRGVEAEPNDTIGAADLRARDGLDVAMAGAVNSDGDLDLYAVDVPPGRALRADVIPDAPTTLCQNLNVSIQLVDKDATGLGAMVGPGETCPFVDGTGTTPKNPAARNTTTTTQTFYVAVARGGSLIGSSLVKYRVAITVR